MNEFKRERRRRNQTRNHTYDVLYNMHINTMYYIVYINLKYSKSIMHIHIRIRYQIDTNVTLQIYNALHN